MSLREGSDEALSALANACYTFLWRNFLPADLSPPSVRIYTVGLTSQENDYLERFTEYIVATNVPSHTACPPTPRTPWWTVDLECFTRYVLFRTHLASDVVCWALLLLYRLKIRFRQATCTELPRLLFAALMVANKVTQDEPFRIRSWVEVACGTMSRGMMNRLEWEFCQRLEWDILFEVWDGQLEEFKDRIGWPVFRRENGGERCALQERSGMDQSITSMFLESVDTAMDEDPLGLVLPAGVPLPEPGVISRS